MTDKKPSSRKEALQEMSFTEELVLDDGKTRVVAHYDQLAAKRAFELSRELRFARGIKEAGDISIYTPDFERLMSDFGLDMKDRGERQLAEELLEDFAGHHRNLGRVAFTEAMMVAVLQDLFFVQRVGKQDVVKLKKGVKAKVPETYFENPPALPRIPAPPRRLKNSVAEQMVALMTVVLTDNPEFQKNINDLVLSMRHMINAIDEQFDEDDVEDLSAVPDTNFQPESVD